MYSAITLALLSQVSAFGLLVIRSGSTVQNAGIEVTQDGHLGISGGSDFNGQIDSDGKLTVGGKAVGVDSDGFFVVGGENPPKFGQNDGHLTVDGSDGFNVCPNENKVGSGSAKCDDVVNVALRILPGSDDAATTSAAGAATTAAATDAAGSTAVVEKTVVETVCTHETCTGVAPANGAIRNSVFGGAAAIAAALL